jgi:hypothetical protein
MGVVNVVTLVMYENRYVCRKELLHDLLSLLFKL